MFPTQESQPRHSILSTAVYFVVVLRHYISLGDGVEWQVANRLIEGGERGLE